MSCNFWIYWELIFLIIGYRKKFLKWFLIFGIGGAIIFFLHNQFEVGNHFIAGGTIHKTYDRDKDTFKFQVFHQDEKTLSSERFRRPSKQLPFPNPYSFQDFEKQNSQTPLITKKFESSQEVLLAYYGILREAENMLGYAVGCGTIGNAKEPYPYAYELLTKEKQQQISFHEFVNSFQGIGYITLLKLIPVYREAGTPSSIKYYMVEIEAITGMKVEKEKDYDKGSLFAYYYGIATVEETATEGFKIKQIDYYPEDFLCAPMHSWFYLSDAVVEIVYQENLKIVEKIDSIEQKGDIIYIYASGYGKKYRFIFVRITNGYDILLHESIWKDGKWQDTSLLTDKWSDFKLSPK